MRIQCNNENKSNSTIGMLLPCHTIFRYYDYPLLLPGIFLDLTSKSLLVNVSFLLLFNVIDNFFFLFNFRVQVRNTGSWMEIGNSISHFGIVSAQVVFVLLLFALTNIYTKDIQISPNLSSQKAM